MSDKPDKMCSWHKPKGAELYYLEHHAWADQQIKDGNTQRMCPVCKRWFFPCEYGKPKDGE